MLGADGWSSRASIRSRASIHSSHQEQYKQTEMVLFRHMTPKVTISIDFGMTFWF